MSRLFGRHDPLLRQGALPPLAGRGVGGGAEIDQGGGQGAAGRVQSSDARMRLRRQAGRVLPGPFDRRQGVLQTVAGPAVGDGHRGGETDHGADQGVHEPLGDEPARAPGPGANSVMSSAIGVTQTLPSQ